MSYFLRFITAANYLDSNTFLPIPDKEVKERQKKEQWPTLYSTQKLLIIIKAAVDHAPIYPI
jgi:hypothetical protein